MQTDNPINSDFPHLTFGTGWVEVEALSDPCVLFRNGKYSPIIFVKVIRSQLDYVLYISAKSIATSVEEVRQRRGSLAGAKFAIRKESEDRFSSYDLKVLQE